MSGFQCESECKKSMFYEKKSKNIYVFESRKMDGISSVLCFICMHARTYMKEPKE